MELFIAYCVRSIIQKLIRFKLESHEPKVKFFKFYTFQIFNFLVVLDKMIV